MKCITDNKEAAKMAVAQLGVGIIMILVAGVSKSLMLFGIGVIVFGFGVRGFLKICKDK